MIWNKIEMLSAQRFLYVEIRLIKIRERFYTIGSSKTILGTSWYF